MILPSSTRSEEEVSASQELDVHPLRIRPTQRILKKLKVSLMPDRAGRPAYKLSLMAPLFLYHLSWSEAFGLLNQLHTPIQQDRQDIHILPVLHLVRCECYRNISYR